MEAKVEAEIDPEVEVEESLIKINWLNLSADLITNQLCGSNSNAETIHIHTRIYFIFFFLNFLQRH